MKRNKGITLIALVITIIVLLILAGVSIAMLTGDNGITTNATKAQSKNAYSYAEEQMNLANMTVKTEIETKLAENSSYDATSTENFLELVNLVKKDLGIISGNTTTDGKWTVTSNLSSNVITITYTDSSISTLSEANHKGKIVTRITIGEQEIKKFIYDLPSLESLGLRLGAEYTLSGNTWKVIGLDEDSLENVLLAMDPVNPEEKWALNGASDWLNCVTKLNDACSKYKVTIGSNEYPARSMNESDMLMLSGFNPTTYTNYGNCVANIVTNASNNKYPYDNTDGYKTGWSTEPNTDGYFTYSFYYFDSSTVTNETARDLLFGTNKNWRYWLASHCVYAENNCARFDVRYVNEGNVGSRILFSSIGFSISSDYCLRPVVSIPVKALK